MTTARTLLVVQTTCVLFVSVYATPSKPVQPAEELRKKRSDDFGSIEVVVMQQSQKIAALEATIQALQIAGSTYVRWGRSQCPNGATTIYSGYGAGGFASHTGTGANRLCLVSNPVVDNTPLYTNGHGSIYGAQYYVNGHTSFTDVVCALCYVTSSATFVVPGTNRCPAGTTEQYHGYLSVGNHGSESASEYVCLDSNPEDRPGSTGNQDCAWFDLTEIVCGSIPCPPYTNGKAATCAVCSK